ncbi:hypothetical protein RhiirC2_851764 [Rhizophagus irregularis]|uniref:Uncharacterized protein n=1 Tax=Rhizophagus irregularis TaxID=588596 RepID=A0A2N1N2B5_9GLOM|nr:hypothetical protein RhiirC2_851764 [Rhizophagus irregularis]
MALKHMRYLPELKQTFLHALLYLSIILNTYLILCFFSSSSRQKTHSHYCRATQCWELVFSYSKDFNWIPRQSVYFC